MDESPAAAVSYDVSLVGSLRPPMRERLREAWYSLRSNPTAMIGLVIILIVVISAVAAPVLAPYDPYQLDLSSTSQPSSAAHLLGTDQYGQDILSRIIWAGRIDLFIALSSVIVSMLIGTLLGAVAGYSGGLSDEGTMRFMDILQSFPRFIFAMGIAFAIGPGLTTVIVATSVLNIPAYSRLMRAMILSAKESQYAMAARGIGLGHRAIVLRHLVPNCLAPIFVQATLHLGWAILEAAGLSFIGLGVEPATAEWGVMVSLGLQDFLQGHWWIYTFPGIAIAVAVLGFNLLGDGLQDILDPRRRA